MPKNPRVYLDISIGGKGGGRVIFELFTDLTPRTCENFRGLCTGEYGIGRTTKKRLCYEGCSFFRCIKDGYLQSGDFEKNNGDGGESVFGGTFNDEDFSRRHTQGGVLSMANKGRNTNGSQFFITLKRNVRLDGKHIAFGQVVDGMDVIRACSQVPVDKDQKPRVPIMIVGCGEVGKKVRSQADVHEQASQRIAALTEEFVPTDASLNAAQKAKAILGGKQGGAAVEEASGSRGKQTKNDEEGGAAPAPPKNERERKLHELRMRMNQSRSANSKEVIEEQKRAADPDYARRKAAWNHKEEMGETKKKGEEGEDEKESRGVAKGKDYLLDTLEKVELQESKKKRGNPDAFGWDVFNQDSLYRAHDKRLKHMTFDEKAYNEQKEKLATGMDVSLAPGVMSQPSEEAKDRLQNALEEMAKKKGQYSRRRAHCAEEDVNYINERNRFFNKKMQRFFGEYTEETRQNLERGTAL